MFTEDLLLVQTRIIRSVVLPFMAGKWFQPRTPVESADKLSIYGREEDVNWWITSYGYGNSKITIWVY